MQALLAKTLLTIYYNNSSYGGYTSFQSIQRLKAGLAVDFWTPVHRSIQPWIKLYERENNNCGLIILQTKSCTTQSLAIMPWLSFCFTTTILRLAGTWGPVLIFGRWYRTVTAVLFSLVTQQLAFKSFYSSKKYGDFSKFLDLYLYDTLQIFNDYFIGWFHSLCNKIKPEIH